MLGLQPSFSSNSWDCLLTILLNPGCLGVFVIEGLTPCLLHGYCVFGNALQTRNSCGEDGRHLQFVNIIPFKNLQRHWIGPTMIMKSTEV